MSAYLYDKVLVERLKEVTGDSRIRVIDPDNALSFIAQIGKKDKDVLPAIVLKRGPIALDDYRSQPVALKGETAKIDSDNYVVKAQLIPFRMSWDIDVYTVDRYTCDEIVRELIFYFVMNPRFTVEIPYGLDIKQNFDVFVDSDIQDNSDLVEFENRGEMFRETITVHTENAHFYWTHRQYQVFGKPDVDTFNKSNKGDE